MGYKVLAAYSDAVDKLQAGEKSVSTEQVREELSDQNISPATVGRVLSRLRFEKLQVPTVDSKTIKRTIRHRWKVNRDNPERLKAEYQLRPASDTVSATMDRCTEEATPVTASDGRYI